MFRTSGESALLFDFGGTLDADGQPWVDRFFQLYVASGGHATPAGFRRVFARTDAALAILPGIETFDYSRTVTAQARLLADLLPDDRDLDWDDLGRQVTRDACRASARNRDMLAVLSGRHPLGVVSNFQGNLHRCLEELGLLDLFTVVTDSGRVGIRKPDPAIFRSTLAGLSADANESWMIGDSPISDIEPASALGMLTCWIAPEDRSDGLPAVVPTARVARLIDLPVALDAACRH